MTNPVGVYEGDTLMLSRKVTNDWHLLQPTPEIKKLVGYMYVYWAQRYRENVYGLNILGTHTHVGYDDPDGIWPKFLCMAHHWIARILNRRYGRTGQHFFAPGPPRPARLLDTKTVDSRLTYIVANAPGHGICADSYDWPGLLFGPEQVGEELTFERPPELKNSEIFPPDVTFVVPAPPHVRHLPDHEIGAHYRALRRKFEAEQYIKRDGCFMGVQRALGREPFERPHAVKTGGRKPFFIASSTHNRAAARKARASFLARYEARLKAFRDGDRTSNWPSATYKMRHQLGLPPPT